MALINKIRERTGLAVGIITVGMIAFVVGSDIVGPNSTLLGKNERNAGEISGDEISKERFDSKVGEIVYTQRLNGSGENPSSEEMVNIRNQAWEMLIRETAFQEEYDELGVQVTNAEFSDMVNGDNLNASVAGSFINPETQELDRAQLNQFIQFMKAVPEDYDENQEYEWRRQKAGWENFLKELQPSREFDKYLNLMSKTNYTTKAEAKQEYEKQLTTYDLQYLYVPYYSLNDSVVSPSDSQLKHYLADHNDEFQSFDARDIKFVSFPILPSSLDSTYFKDELVSLIPEFKVTKNDSIVALANSDAKEILREFNMASMPKVISAKETLMEGDVVGPYVQGASFVITKLVKQLEDDSIYSAKASHILIKSDGENEDADAEAKAKATDLLKRAKAGEDFGQLAKANSEDYGSARTNGSLGWFTEGRMVEPFEKAVFGTQNAGLVNRLIQTNYGYHIIFIEAARTKARYQLMDISREITPMDASVDDAFRQADFFKANSIDYESFEAYAETEGIKIQTVNKIRNTTQKLSGKDNSRGTVIWAFSKDTKLGDISTVYDLGDEYLIAAVTGEYEDGDSKLDEVKDQIAVKVRNELKGDIIIEKLSGLSGSLQEIANAYGTDAKIYSKSDLKPAENSLPTVGFSPVSIGRALALEQGEQSASFKAENGVVIVKVIRKQVPVQIEDYAMYEKQVTDRLTNAVVGSLIQAIKDNAEIKDLRYLFN